MRSTQSIDKIIEYLDQGIEAYNEEFITLISKIRTNNKEKDKEFIIEILINDIKSIYSNIEKIIEYIKLNEGVDLKEILIKQAENLSIESV